MAEHGDNPHLAHLTASQQRAIQTVDRSVLVSAAAGAGKTTVLAERCAYLVADLPRDRRCGVDELLVVTFTDAAAGEMRSRIRSALQKRLEASPSDEHLRQQLYLLDSASISTIHAFCKELIQRWFPQARVDPQASVLDADEADLLRRETLDGLFVELYGGDSELARAFQGLVDDYGAGNDYTVSEIVLRVHDFIGSVPDPEGWLKDATRRLDADQPGSLAAELDRLQQERLAQELDMQVEAAQRAAETIRERWSVAEIHAASLDGLVEQLTIWQRELHKGEPTKWEAVADDIRAYECKFKGQKPRNAPEDVAEAFDMALALRNESREDFRERLQSKLCSFSREEYLAGLQQIAPYVATLTALVAEFDRRYRDVKTAQAALDFNDLQRYALRVLSEGGDARRPSDVAKNLHRRYRYVLVDEFQDIDPLHAAILDRASRESADPPEGNLFAVGDIKQSIYRFRLAEPKLFADRAAAFRGENTVGTLIALQENVRSRQHVLEAINDVFRPLMRADFGGSDYDAEAELHAGATYPDDADGPVFNRPAVELHLLEPVTEATRRHADEEDEAGDASPGDADGDELEGIEREAHLIATRIQSWMGHGASGERRHVADRPESPGGPPRTRPIAYGDIVILLRSLPHKAEPIAEVLRRQDVPVRIERATDTIDSTEFRDVVSLLRVLDNRQQDIPLAAVLRSPLLGVRFDETDLLDIRLIDRDARFHAAAERYVRNGSDAGLRERLRFAWATLDRWRERMQREPVADVLWDMYEQSHYLSFVSGLPEPERRRARLIELHELARQFGRFQRQGLRRFLRFLDDVAAREQQPRQPAADTAEQDVVRIMTIHASKGLEFPVVVLADLSKRFNLEDVNRTVVVDRELGVAMRAADPERRVYYPTFAHHQATDKIRRENLSEELRVLYVALTRAREHLMLVGRMKLERVEACRAAARPGRRPTRLQLETANCPLDWLLPAVSAVPAGAIRWPGEDATPNPLFEVHAYPRAATDRWALPSMVHEQRAEPLRALANLDPLPPAEPIASAESVGPIFAAIDAVYDGLELTTLPARVAASELKRRWDVLSDVDERLHPRRPPAIPRTPPFLAPEAADTATARGMATHRFLQLVDLRRPCDADDLQRQRQALIDAGRLTADEAGLVSLDDAAWFFATDLGRRVRDRADRVQREVAFVSRVPPERYDPAVAAREPRDVVLVRGMVDVLLTDEAGLEIIDYKTDRVEPAACAERAASYTEQIKVYADAMHAIHRRPVAAAWLVFLHARQVIPCPATPDPQAAP